SPPVGRQHLEQPQCRDAGPVRGGAERNNPRRRSDSASGDHAAPWRRPLCRSLGYGLRAGAMTRFANLIVKRRQDMLVNGKWVENWQPVQKADEQGRFVRQVSEFRNWITPDGRPGPTGEGGFEAEAGRYRLYVALICPWASRTLIARRLKGLADLIPVTVV